MSLELGATIQKLSTFSNTSYPIISLYIPIPDANGNTNKQMVKEFNQLIDGSFTEVEKGLAHDDIIYIDSYLREFQNKHSAKGLVIFSGGNHVSEIIPTSFSVTPNLHIGHSPYLQPLLEAFNKYRRYLVILADRKKAKILSLYLDHLEHEKDLDTGVDVPQKVRGRNIGDRQSKVDRHIQDHLHRHLKVVGKEVDTFTREHHISGIIIGAHQSLLHTVEKHLPKVVQKKIVGSIHVEPDASINWIVGKSKEIVQEVNKKFNQQQMQLAI